jgi:uncharacterized protein involved in outer membrane biogenesis
MRKVIIVVAVVVVLALVAVFALPAMLDVNQYRGRIQAELQQKLHRDVTLGDMSFNTGRPFAIAQELAVRVELAPLLHHDVHVDSLELERPQVELVRNAQGVWNFASLQSGQPAQSGNSGSLSLAQLSITDGQVAIADQQKHQSRAVYDHIDLNISGYAPDKAFDVTLAAHLPGSGRQTLQFDGKLGPMNAQDSNATPVDGTLKLQEVSLAGVQKFLNSPALAGYDGTATGDVKLRNENGRMTSSGTIDIADARINAVNIGYPIKADYDVAGNLATDQIHINKAKIDLGPTPVSVSGDVNSRPTPSEVNLNIQTTNASIAELAKLAGAMSSMGDVNGSGTISLNVHAQGPLDQRLTYSGNGAVQNASITTPQLTRPLQIHTANISFSQNTAQVSNLQLSLGSSNASGSATIRNLLDPRIQFALNADKLNLTELQQITSAPPPKRASRFDLVPSAEAAAPSGPMSHFASSGTLTAGSIILDQLLLNNFRSNLSLSGAASANLMRTLNGDVTFSSDNGKLQGTDLLHELSAIGKFLQPGQAAQGFTNIVKLAGAVNIRNGVASTNNLQAVIDAGTLAAAGTADLVSEQLNLHMTATLAQALSQKVGGNQIGGFMNTALANNQGQLVLPVLVTGTMQHPMFAPDIQQIAQMKLRGLAGGAGGGVQGILGALTGKKQQQNTAEPANPVNQLMGLFGKKKKQ